jgi:hypothetical protein
MAAIIAAKVPPNIMRKRVTLSFFLPPPVSLIVLV